jgi:hypothetical protein
MRKSCLNNYCNTFGTFKVVIEYIPLQTLLLLKGVVVKLMEFWLNSLNHPRGKWNTRISTSMKTSYGKEKQVSRKEIIYWFSNMWIDWQYCEMSMKKIHNNLNFIKCNIRWKTKGGHWSYCCLVRASSKIQQKIQLITGKGVEVYEKLHPKSNKNNQPFTSVNIWESVGTSFTCLWQGWYSRIFNNQY